MKAQSQSAAPKPQKAQPSKPAAATSGGYLKYGNRDHDQKYDLSGMRVRKDNVYVVRHYNIITTPGGAQIEDPASSRFQVYDKDVYDNLNKQVKGFGDHQQQSAFESQGLNVEVLHEPA